MRYLLDTNVFNRLTADTALLARLAGHGLFVIHTQRDELNDTPDALQRAELVKALEVVEPTQRASRSAVWGVSKWDESCWSDDSSLYQALLADIKAKDKRSKRHLGQVRDALTAETAIKEGLTLVTDDCVLREVTTAHGGQAITLDQL